MNTVFLVYAISLPIAWFSDFYISRVGGFSIHNLIRHRCTKAPDLMYQESWWHGLILAFFSPVTTLIYVGSALYEIKHIGGFIEDWCTWLDAKNGKHIKSGALQGGRWNRSIFVMKDGTFYFTTDRFESICGPHKPLDAVLRIYQSYNDTKLFLTEFGVKEVELGWNYAQFILANTYQVLSSAHPSYKVLDPFAPNAAQNYVNKYGPKGRQMCRHNRITIFRTIDRLSLYSATDNDGMITIQDANGAMNKTTLHFI